MRRTLALVVALLTLLAGPGCLSSREERVDVLSTFYPLHFLADRIASSHLRVGVLIPADVEPHEYELRPSDLARVQHARLVVYQGAGLEPFRDQLVRLARDHDVPVQAATEGISLRAGDDHEEPGPDPHLWLDPVLFAAEARNVERAVERIDPGNTTDYRSRLERLLGDLDALHRDFSDGLTTCHNRKIITTHAAFGYLAARYDFTMFSISGIEPDSEPSAAKIREMSDLARREGINVIFFETLVSPKIAELVAREIGGRTLVLDPIEGITNEEATEGRDYLSQMRLNLANLKDAMGCTS